MGRPEHGALGALCVLNDDEFAPGGGFPLHTHKDMEIITYVRRGAITHEDNLGNVGRTEAGDVQVMSAGSGISHSEHNLENEPTQLFQIWIKPREPGGAPGWSNRRFPRGDGSGRLVILASGDPRDVSALPLRADARVLAGTMAAGEQITYALSETHLGYVVTSSGQLEINGVRLEARDGAAIRNEIDLTLTAIEDTELVLVDLG